MNRNVYTLAIAVLSLGLGGAAVAGDYSGNRTQTTTGADSATSQNTQAQHRFSDMDRNKDGKLSQSEIEASDKKGKLTDNWSTIDTNQDGSVDESEYNRFKSTYKDQQHKGTGSSQHDGNTSNSQGTNRGTGQTDQR